MGYANERTKARLQAAVDEGPRGFWDGLTDNVATRFVSQGFDSVLPIARGLANMGGAVVSDVALEPIRQIIPGGDQGFREEGSSSSILNEIVKPMAQSFANTVDTAGDVAFLPNVLFKGMEEAKDEFGERKEEFSTNPFEFVLEHAGNVSMAGAALSAPARLGIAASRGAVKPRNLWAADDAVRAEVWPRARAATREAATEAREAGRRFSAPQVTEFAGDVVGHPIRTALGKAKNSKSAEFFRNPIDEAMARTRLGNWMQRRNSEEGSIAFRPGDMFEEWNGAAASYNHALRAGDTARAARNKVRLDELDKQLRSQGYEPRYKTEDYTHGNSLTFAELFDPAEFVFRDPSRIETREDFQWVDDGDFEGDRFVTNVLERVQDQLNVYLKDKKPTPDEQGRVFYTDSFGEQAVAKLDKNGNVIAALTVNKWGIDAATHPDYRGQGIAKDLIEWGLPKADPDLVQEALSRTTTSEFGTPLQASFLRSRQAETGRKPPQVRDPEGLLKQAHELAKQDQVDFEKYPVEDVKELIDRASREDFDGNWVYQELIERHGFPEFDSDLADLNASGTELFDEAIHSPFDINDMRTYPEGFPSTIAAYQDAVWDLIEKSNLIQGTDFTLNKIIDLMDEGFITGSDPKAIVDLIKDGRVRPDPAPNMTQDPYNLLPEDLQESMEQIVVNDQVQREGIPVDEFSERFRQARRENFDPENPPRPNMAKDEDYYRAFLDDEPRPTTEVYDRAVSGDVDARDALVERYYATRVLEEDIFSDIETTLEIEFPDIDPEGMEVLADTIYDLAETGHAGAIAQVKRFDDYNAREQQLMDRAQEAFDQLTDEREAIEKIVGEPEYELRTTADLEEAGVSQTEFNVLNDAGFGTVNPMTIGMRVREGHFSGFTKYLYERFSGRLDETGRSLDLLRNEEPTKFFIDNADEILEVAQEYKADLLREGWDTGSPVISQADELISGIKKVSSSIRGDLQIVNYRMPQRRSNLPETLGDETTQATFSDMMRQLFGDESGSISLGGTGRRVLGEDAMSPMQYGSNLAGIKAQDFFNSPIGRRFTEPVREAKSIVRDRNLAYREGEGPIWQRALAGATNVMRGQGVRGLSNALDARTVEAKFLHGLRTLGRRPEGADYQGLLGRIQGDDSSRLTRVKEVASGERPVGANLRPEVLVANILEVFDEAKRRAGSSEGLTSEIGVIAPGVDAEGLALLGLSAIERMNNLGDGTLLAALGDYVQGDKFLLDTNRRAQQIMEAAGKNETPARFRLSDEELKVDLNSLPAEHVELFYEAARQRRITQGALEKVKLNDPRFPFNARSGTRIGLGADDATHFGISDQYLNEVLETYDMTLDDFGGNAEAALDALDELQGEFFDVDVESIKRGNPTTQQKRSLERKQKEYERAVKKRNDLNDELDKLQSKDRWTKRDWERFKDLQEARKTSLNQVLTSAARLGKLRETVVGSLEAAPVSARNLMLYAREVVPQHIETLQGMIEDGVGDASVIQGVIDDLKAVPRTLDELNDAEVYVSYLKDVRDIPTATTTGYRSSATRTPSVRRRGTGLDAAYNRDYRDRLFSQDADFQRYYIARSVQDVVKERGLSRTGEAILTSDEFGFTPEEVRNMPVGKINDELSQAGYRAFDADSLFETRRTAVGDPIDAYWVRSEVGEILTNGVEDINWFEQNIVEPFYDKALRAWKVAVLPLRPAWQVNNILGNAFLTMFAGKMGPMNYGAMLRASTKAVRQWNDGLARIIEVPISPRYLGELRSKLDDPTVTAAEKVHIKDMVDRGTFVLDNTVMNEISASGMTTGDFAFLNNTQFFKELKPHQQGFLRKAGIRTSHPRQPKNLADLDGAGIFERGRQRARNLRATGREVVDYAYHINETIDNIHRTMVYLDRMGKGADHATAISAVNKALGNYNKMSSFERRIVRRVYPFWPWMRHMMEVTARSLAPDDINRTVISAHIATIMGQENEWEEMLPEWAAGDIFLGLNDDETPMFLSTRGANPYLDVFDPITQPNMRGLLRPVSPFIGMGAEQLTGISQLTGRPFSSPIRRADQQVPRPSLWEQSINQLPHLKVGRDVYRDLTGQPLARYGTGEPAIFPGAESGRSGLRSVTQLFGANIRPINVQQFEAQHKRRLFQEASDRARQEAKERAFASENARSLGPGVFGFGG